MAASKLDRLSLPSVPAPAPSTHPWRDRLLSTLFVVAIALPGVALIVTSGRTVTQFENRRASPWPGWSNLVTNERFTTAFERAFADRFGGRDALIRLHHTAIVAWFRTSPVPEVVLGRNGWLFLTPGYNEIGSGPPTAETRRRNRDFASVVAAIASRADYLAQRGVDYLLVVVPDKHTIYPEFLPTSWRPGRDESLLDAVLSHLPARARSHVLDLRPSLLAAKRVRQVYWRTDTHWNLSGAWVGYHAIHAMLEREPSARMPAIPSETVNGNMSGDLATMIGLPKLFNEPNTALGPDAARWLCAHTATGSVPVWGAPQQTLYCAGAKFGTAAIYHDSALVPLLPWLPDDFRVSRWVHGRDWDLRELAADPPAILIDEIVERNLPALADMSFLDRAAVSIGVSPAPGDSPSAPGK